jgi:hypothetical protein
MKQHNFIHDVEKISLKAHTILLTIVDQYKVIVGILLTDSAEP